MQSSSAGSTARLAAYGLLAAAAAACSADPSRLAGPSSLGAPAVISQSVAPENAVIAGPDGGAWVNGITANNSGRINTEFWDNLSADDPPGDARCNSGFFAVGNFSPGCNVWGAENGTGNAGGYSQWWAKLSAGVRRDAAAFTFDGTTRYTLKLEGTFASGTSEIGVFYVNNGTRVFVPIAQFGAKDVNSTYDLVPATVNNQPWGFYIANTFNTQPPSCGTTPSGLPAFCSDATGTALGPDNGPTPPFQQWALFANANRTKYLVGGEDNNLELLPDGNQRDSDFNDYMISITPLVDEGGQGCTPGFWKNTGSANWATTGYSPNQQFSSVFENAFPGMTLDQVLGQGGGGLNALGRHTVAALLNAASTGVSYEYTPAEVIAKFNAVYPGGDYETLKNDFEAQNQLGCPLNNGRGSR